jgi:hypothetical protein
VGPSERQLLVLFAVELVLDDGSVVDDGVVEFVDAVVDGLVWPA